MYSAFSRPQFVLWFSPSVLQRKKECLLLLSLYCHFIFFIFFAFPFLFSPLRKVCLFKCISKKWFTPTSSSYVAWIDFDLSSFSFPKMYPHIFCTYWNIEEVCPFVTVKNIVGVLQILWLLQNLLLSKSP
jgi:hypothetical protein